MTTPTHSHKAWTDKGGHVSFPANNFRSLYSSQPVDNLILVFKIES
jgi:hypothetical protein